MECLEELEKLDIDEVSKRTHISILEIRAIIEEDFSSFNHSKAIGFTKIFKRDFNIDLEEWLNKFIENTGAKEAQDEIFVISDEKTDRGIRTKLLYLLIVVAVIFTIGLIYSSISSDKTKEKAVKNIEIVKEAEKVIVETKIKEEEILIPVPKKEVEKLKPKVIEKKVTKVFIEASQDLWIGVRDNDTKKTKNKIFKGSFELDPEKDYTITFGHGYFTLVVGDKKEVVKKSGPQKYSYSNGRFEQLKYTPPTPKEGSDSNIE